MFSRLYDLMVYLTTYYSKLPDDFKKQFSEAECVNLRLDVSKIDWYHIKDIIEENEQ